MAQIFVSHSRHDSDLVDFFARLAARTNVRLVVEELENLVSGQVNTAAIQQHIAQSNALFILLSTHVQALPHTRDWVVWEAGVGNNKDIWVFERASDARQINVVTPYLRHFVVFEPNDSFFTYLAPVLESYDDSHVLGTTLATAGLGAAFGGLGALAGAALGLIGSDKSKLRPLGRPSTCASCMSTYSIHLPLGATTFQCPVCNQLLVIPGGFGTAA